MKIQCDVCNKDEASVFCTADEAALCNTCDHRVHHANKLASKHKRFSLLNPSSKEFPLCDVCQVKRAFLFCRQDRAILCKECDVPIHTANELTKKHDRFLLTGVKLSATSDPYTPSSSVASVTNKGFTKSQIATPALYSTPKSSNCKTNQIMGGQNDQFSGMVGVSTSSISEYLTETLPGWHVEDFLDSSIGFCKNDGDDGLFSFPNMETNMNSFQSENLGIWVPETTTPLNPNHYTSLGGYGEIGMKQTKNDVDATTTISFKGYYNNKWEDDTFTVPQIRSSTIGSKRSRQFGRI